MKKYENCRHDDILVEDSWEDEIDLVMESLKCDFFKKEDIIGICLSLLS